MQVRAIILYPEIFTEAASYQSISILDMYGQEIGSDEEVFLSQLVRRARVLNNGFQKMVRGVVLRHSSGLFTRLPSNSISSESFHGLCHKPSEIQRSSLALPSRLPSEQCEARLEFRCLSKAILTQIVVRAKDILYTQNA